MTTVFDPNTVCDRCQWPFSIHTHVDGVGHSCPTPERARSSEEFPLYLMREGTREGEGRVWETYILPLHKAGVLFDSGWSAVEIDGRVLEACGSMREITQDERIAIRDIADRASCSK